MCIVGKFTLSVAYSPCGSFLATGSFDGTVTLFDLKTTTPFKLVSSFYLPRLIFNVFVRVENTHMQSLFEVFVFHQIQKYY